MKGLVKSPEELFSESKPKFVYEEFEMMILERFNTGSAVFTEDEIIERIKKHRGYYESQWLDVIPEFEANGWIASRGRVDDNDLYPVVYSFKKAKK